VYIVNRKELSQLIRNVFIVVQNRPAAVGMHSTMSTAGRSSCVRLVVALCISVTVLRTGGSGEVDSDQEFDVDSVQQLISDIDHVVACRRVPGKSRTQLHGAVAS